MNNFEYINTLSVSTLKKLTKQFTEQQWNEFDFRQKTFDVHKKTKTIPLIYNQQIDKTPTECSYFKTFEKELYKVFAYLRNMYGQGYILRAILVKLKANSEIGRHIDDGYGLENCKRHHIPIITNKNIFFTVDDETLNMKEGEIWFINNLNKYHSVSNKSKKDRVHLIVDWSYE